MSPTAIVSFVSIVWSVFAIVWAASVYPTVSLAYTADRAAHAIAGGETFAPDVLQKFDDRLSGVIEGNSCASPLMWDRVLVRMALADIALQAREITLSDERIGDLGRSARDTLLCSPHDGVAWLILYWVETRQSGLQDRALLFLRASYRFAPREAWIDLRRSRLVMPILQYLPVDLKVEALAEYRNLVRSRLLSGAIEILASLDRSQRNEAMTAVNALPFTEIEDFEKQVKERKLVDETLLMLPKRPDRPWWR